MQFLGQVVHAELLLTGQAGLRRRLCPKGLHLPLVPDACLGGRHLGLAELALQLRDLAF